MKQEIDGEVFLCQAGNINTGGMLLVRAADGLRSPSPRCWLEFSLPGAEQIFRLRGRIIWEELFSSYHMMAVRFVVVAPSHRRCIGSYLDGEPFAPLHPAWDAVLSES